MHTCHEICPMKDGLIGFKFYISGYGSGYPTQPYGGGKIFFKKWRFKVKKSLKQFIVSPKTNKNHYPEREISIENTQIIATFCWFFGRNDFNLLSGLSDLKRLYNLRRPQNLARSLLLSTVHTDVGILLPKLF